MLKLVKTDILERSLTPPPRVSPASIARPKHSLWISRNLLAVSGLKMYEKHLTF